MYRYLDIDIYTSINICIYRYIDIYVSTYMYLYIYTSIYMAPVNSERSSLTCWFTSMILAPARSCMIRPEVTIGEMPSSMSVPRFDARMTRIQ
jgi:hypothetical protein